MRDWNDRSDAVMRERLEKARKATKGPWYHTLAAIVGTKKSPEDNDATCICFTEWGCSGDSQANAAHIAASSPDVVQADLEEILRLRAENELLRGEVESLNKQANWLVKMLSHYTEDCPLKFKLVYEERFPIPKIDNCHGQEGDIEDCAYFSTECWREAARKAVEKEERHG